MNKLAIVLCTLIFSGMMHAQTEVVIYGDDSYPPYSFKESGRLTGIYTVILEKAFEKMPDYKVKMKGLPWKRGLSKIEKAEIFALFPPYKRVKERPYMEYEESILNEELVVYCRKDILEKDRPNWPDDYSGLTIGKNAGFSVGGDKFLALVKAGNIKIQETKGTPKNLLKLIAGRVDCYMNDGLSIQWELKKLASEDRYDGKSIVKGAIISAEQGFLGFVTQGSAYSYKSDFKAKYHAILKEMKQSGEIENIVKNFVE